MKDSGRVNVDGKGVCEVCVCEMMDGGVKVCERRWMIVNMCVG